MGESDHSEGDNDSVDTQTLMERELGLGRGKRFEDSSDSEDDDSTDSRQRPFKGLFKFTPQEVYRSLKGDEDPNEEGWNRKFLSTKIQTDAGEMSFIQALANKRTARRWVSVRDSVNRGGENSYVPTLHITQNQGFNASMLTELSHKAFRKLQNEFSTAEAVTPGQVDFAALIPKSMHTQLCIEFIAYCGAHLPDEKPWLKEVGDRWKKWKPSTFFERVMRVYPPPGVARESALLTQLMKLPLKYSERENYLGVTEWFRGINTILEGYDDKEISQEKVLKSIARKLRAQCQGAYIMTNRLLEKNPQNFQELWAAWETQRRVIGAANLLVKEVAPGDLSQDRPDPYKDRDNTRETGAERRKKRREEKARRNAEQRSEKTRANRDNGDEGDKSSTQCKVCGREHGGQCRLAKHPDANNSDKDWADSEKGKRWKAKGMDVLSSKRLLSGDPWTNPDSKKQPHDKKRGGSKYKSESSWAKAKYDYLYAMQYVDDDEYTLPCHIHNEIVNSPLLTRMLIDTGALQSNYVNLQTAAFLRKAQAQSELLEGTSDTQGDSCKSAEEYACLNVVRGESVVSVTCNACDACKTKESSINSLSSPVVSSAVVQEHNTTSLKLKRKSRKTSSGKSITTLRRAHLRRNLENINSNKITRVCSGITGMCTDSPGEINFSLPFCDS